ncbi:MAG: hypothetical protein HY717_11475 [Planctomycetes bacterium]|nr:hypothetical protein [Planctomycetota bacterium]
MRSEPRPGLPWKWLFFILLGAVLIGIGFNCHNSGALRQPPPGGATGAAPGPAGKAPEAPSAPPAAPAQAAPPQAEATSTAAPAAAPSAPAGGPCAAQIQSCRDLFKTIPADFRELKEPLDAVVERVEKCRDQLEKFLADCPSLEGAHDAGYMLARLLMSLSRRHYMKVFQQQQNSPEKTTALMKEYHNRIIALSRAAVAKAGERDLLRAQCHDLIGDSSYQNRDYEEALKNYQVILEKFPDFPEMGNTILAAGHTYLELRRYQDGFAFIRKTIEARQQDPNLPNYHEVLWKLREAAGDLDAMEQLAREVQKVFPPRLMKPGIGRTEEEDTRRYLGYSGFRLGYVLFAKGDLGAAHEAFSQHIEEMNRRDEELVKQGGDLTPELKIFRNRSIDIARIVDENAGKPPESDLGELLWATPREVRLAPNLGKAAALIFRGAGDSRSAPFLKALDRHLAAHPERKALVAISYLKDDSDPRIHVEALQAELAGLGLESAAAGLDPDQKNKALFRAFKVMVGSATFLIFDPQGNLAWYQQDPREVDINLGINIWERIAGQ